MSTGRLFVGLDVSMRATGLVVLSDCGDVLSSERIGWSASEFPCKTLRQRIAYFAQVSKAIRASVQRAADLATVQIAIEDYATHGPGDPTLAPELGGIVRLGLLSFDIAEVSTTSLKRYATGKGNAQKDAIMLAVFKRWAFDCDGDNNLADAYVLARMVRDAAVGTELSAAQLEVLSRAGLRSE